MIHNGSRKVNLHSIAIGIFRLCMANGITLNSRWIPRSLNNFADFVSKLTDYDDWVVSERIFLYLDLEWGPHTIDRFANIDNKKLGRFNSRFWAPGSEAVDAFSQDWAGENNWLVPPIYLIPSVIPIFWLVTQQAPLSYRFGLQHLSGHCYLKHPTYYTTIL